MGTSQGFDQITILTWGVMIKSPSTPELKCGDTPFFFGVKITTCYKTVALTTSIVMDKNPKKTTYSKSGAINRNWHHCKQNHKKGKKTRKNKKV